jgi:nucleoside-diphosphate-sugar epimerase
VENAAAAVVLAATDERASGRVYYVAEINAYSEMEWVRAIGRAVGWSGDVVTLTRDRIPRVRVPTFNTDQDLVVDTLRIRQELGYAEPIDLENALRAAVAWEHSDPPTSVDPDRFDYVAEDAALQSK